MRAATLPIPGGTFVGRTLELGRIANGLQARRMVTITGEGGVGKSRLAVQCAWNLRHQYRDGVSIVDLSSESPTLDMHNQRNTLIVLDNCDRSLETCTEITRELLSSSQFAHVLLTSRHVPELDAPVCRVPPLDLPDAQRLFAERACCNEDCDAVTQICRNLEGVPLALVLAASRVPVLGLEEVAALSADRDRVLSLRTSEPASPAHHRTLAACLEWSMDLLPHRERRLLDWLVHLEDGWTTDDAEHAGFHLEPGFHRLFETLVARSLVRVQRAPDGLRYSLSRILKSYLRQKRGASLTGREQQVLALLARGLSNKEIGRQLKISDATARIHVEHILSKLGLRSRTQAAVWALQRTRE